VVTAAPAAPAARPAPVAPVAGQQRMGSMAVVVPAAWAVMPATVVRVVTAL
jgi:hypothetical protein